MRGRKPKLQAIAGGLADVPRAPSRLTGEALAEWNLVLPDLIARRVLTPAMMAGVEAYCLAVAGLRECQGIVAREGHTISTPSGSRRHPASQIMTQMLSEQRRWAAELGLTPTSRDKGNATPTREESSDAYADLGI